MVKVTGYTRQGQKIELPHCVSLSLGRSRQSPAAGLEAEFAVEGWVEQLASIGVATHNRQLFDGAVDLQRYRVGRGGRLLAVEARSRGAVLLDNEAMPCVWLNARLSAIFRQVAQPYGFVCYRPAASRSLPQYTVHKGMSEWEALAQFCQMAYRVTPYVVGSQVMVQPPVFGRELVLGQGGLPVCQLEHRYQPYEVLSQILLRDGSGSYRTGVKNPLAAELGVQRKRYVAPGSELTPEYMWDVRSRLARSNQRSQRWTVTLPGLAEAALGQPAVCREIGADSGPLVVHSVQYRLDEGGAVTQLVLAPTQSWL